MEKSIEQFLEFMKETKGISDNTVDSYRRDLYKMKKYFDSVGIKQIAQISDINMNSYLLWLEKTGCASSTISRYISAMKTYFHYMLQMGSVKKDPTMLLKNPVKEKRIQPVLNNAQINTLLKAPAKDSAKEIRDRAMLELMYGTGLRVSEIINLRVLDVNANLGYVIVNSEKSKDKIVPFGDSVKKAINYYLSFSRDKLLKEGRSELLFLNCQGKAMSRQGFWKIIKSYGEQAELSENITPRILRNSYVAHTSNEDKNNMLLQMNKEL